MVPDWWATSKKMLGNFDIKMLLNFDNEKSMNDKKANQLNKLFNDPEKKEFLNQEAILFSSAPANKMFRWVEGQRKLYDVNKKLKPRKIALIEAEKEFKKVNDILQSKQAKLDEMIDNVNALNDKLDKIQRDKKRMDAEYKKYNI